jgi:hypothetical protein
MTNTQTDRFNAFSTLLNTSDFLTPAAMSSIIRIVITKARKSGGRPADRRQIELNLAPRCRVLGEVNSRPANEEVARIT